MIRDRSFGVLNNFIFEALNVKCVFFLFTFILDFGIWKKFPPRWHFHILPLKVCLILLVARRRIVLFSRGRHLFWFGTFLNSSTALLFLFITSLFLSFDNFIIGVTVLVFVYFCGKHMFDFFGVLEF